MKTVRASEIGNYTYCRRALWYQLQGVVNQNQAEMNSGTELHERHGRVVAASGCLRWLAYAALLGAVALVVIQIMSQWLAALQP